MRQDDPDAELEAAQTAAADRGVKALVPVGRPFLDYVLTALADAGFSHMCLVIGPEHQVVRDYYTRTCPPTRVQVHFAIQAQPLGTANAVLAAQDFTCSEEFLVLNSDNYYPLEVLTAVQQLGQPGTVLFEAASLVHHSNIPAERIRAFATCVIDGDGFLADITEKPDDSSSGTPKVVSMNCWRFGPEIYSACHEVALSPRGEYELPLAVKLAIQRGMKFKTRISDSGVLDLSRRSDIATVTERLRNVRVNL